MAPTAAERHQPILVTGMHRSGTTWVGSNLHASGVTEYVNEPLNPRIRGPLLSFSPPDEYPFITREQEAPYLVPLRRLVESRYPVATELGAVRSPLDVGRWARRWVALSTARRRPRRPLLKAPFAVLSCPWFESRLNCAVVIIVRHPAAVVSSLVRLDWGFDLRAILRQPALFENYPELRSLRAAMEEALEVPDDVVGQGALLWKAIYEVVRSVTSTHPSFIVVRHEDLAHSPTDQFEDLYTALSLPWSAYARLQVESASSPRNPSEREHPHDIRLHSRASIDNWKDRLTADVVDRVRTITAGVADAFYTDSDW